MNSFGFKNIDSHYVISLFGITIKKKHANSKIIERKTSKFGLNSSEKRDKKIIVSLTSFPQRINKVHITISHLLTQTLKPDKVILWLASDQFKNKEKDLPDSLLNLVQYGLEIEWCEDIRSYKKLIPTLQKYSDDIIITYDDDIYYEQDSVEKLYKAHLENPNAICTNRYSRILFKQNSLKVAKSSKIYFEKNNSTSKLNILIGCGGVLYPPHSLHQDILNIEQIKTLVPTQDDIYFWAMAVLNDTKIKIVDGFTRNLFTIEETQEHGLCKINSKNKTGLSTQEALDIILKKYPEIIEKLKEEKTR